jgi:DNA-binding response OmpR family regulator
MLKPVALPATNPRSRLSRLPQKPPAPEFATPVNAVALTTNWVGDVEEINKLLSSGVLVLLTPSGSLAIHGITTEAEIVRIGQLEIDLGEHGVRWQGSCIDLSEREIAILACLGEDVGRAFSFADLFMSAWGNSCHIDVLVIHSAVQRIRRKFAAAKVPVTIESVRGYGFRIVSNGHISTNAG